MIKKLMGNVRSLRLIIASLLLTCIRNAFRTPPGIFFGRFILRLLPESHKTRLYDNYYINASFVGAMFNPAIDLEYYSMSEDERERINRERIWGGTAGKKWHNAMAQSSRSSQDKFIQSESFQKYRLPLVLQISELLSVEPQYDTICEIGTGNGMFLEYLSGKFPQIKRFIGIDINNEQVLEDVTYYKNPRLEFAQSEIIDWIKTKCQAGTIIISVNVLEYLSQGELEGILRSSEKISPLAIALSEPINIDLNSDIISKPRGMAAYSYNYPRHLRQHGFNIFRQELRHINPKIKFYDEIIMLAIK